MKLSLHRLTTQRYDTHDGLGLTFLDDDGPGAKVNPDQSRARIAVLIKRGATPEEAAASLELLAAELRTPEPSMVTGEDMLIGNELNHSEAPDRRADGVAWWKAQVDPKIHEGVEIDGVTISVELLRLIIGGGKVQFFRTEDTLTGGPCK